MSKHGLPLHRSQRIVGAATICDIERREQCLRVMVSHMDDDHARTYKHVDAPLDLCARYEPRIGVDVLLEYEDGYLSIIPKEKFDAAYVEIGKPRSGLVLMSAEHPKGWKLEELLDQLRTELRAKNEKLANMDNAVGQIVRANNRHILRLLRECEDFQRNSMAALAQIGPDQGPTGTPRIRPDDLSKAPTLAG